MPMDRREFLLGGIGVGIAATLGGGRAIAKQTESIRAMLKQLVGANEKVVGMIAVTVDERGTRMATFGSSGIPGLTLGTDTVFEIASITKVLTSLLLVDMVQRSEVALDDPVAKYLPASLTLHQRGRPITLLDLASYTSGLPIMPGNMPPKWWPFPIPWSITRRASSTNFSRATCRNMSRAHVTNTPIWASACSVLRWRAVPERAMKSS